MNSIGSAERWAHAYISATALEAKLRPPSRGEWMGEELFVPLRPGRPPELRAVEKPLKTPRAGALFDPRRRAQLLHTFFHHELAAAELMCWAALRFSDAPIRFRRDLLRLADDEIRHANLYADHLQRLELPVGSFPVRDWFWDRVTQVETPTAFVAMLGLGFEGANLDHAARFAEQLQAPDPRAAAIQRQIQAEEVQHVRFAIHWFEHFSGRALSFETFRSCWPPPLTPILARGRPLAREARRRAGMDDEFIDALERF